MRLNNYISASGLCSRREADKWILMKRVRINGKIAELGESVHPNDKVEVDGKTVRPKKDNVYIAFNKPVGVTCTTERHIKGNIIDYINHKERIFPIGRLDKDSEGLILLTSDGSIVNAILREENEHDKEYLVTVHKTIDETFISNMEKGVKIYNPVRKKHTLTKPCKIELVKPKTFRITLNQGLNRQIRRMCSALGYDVITLKRTRIMNIHLNQLKTGKWRDLSHQELKILLKSVK